MSFLYVCLSVSGAVDAQAARRGLQPRMNSRRGRCFLSATKKPGGRRRATLGGDMAVVWEAV